jgi:hypothetical protein
LNLLALKLLSLWQWTMDKIGALEDALKTAYPNLAQVYEERVAQYRKMSMPFDAGVSARKFDALIAKLKGA